eukprot:TRINITY_DN991_c0_g1_i1.p1 TRINITY_DN991_c0_g1~~TRINITY_DN991_c0_g1_i1.p1  ORF type:complete len:350 (+),score=108.07 TRINITY_DN991_c0_g1_i1:36-1052(+)
MTGKNSSMIVAIGNPLLDISVNLENLELLEKYSLTKSKAILAEVKHLPLFNEILSYDPIFVGGGSAQNTMRCAQWLLKIPSATAIVGAVGSDFSGQTLTSVVSKNGTKCFYEILNDFSTGQCAALINENERSLVAFLGASEHLSANYLQHLQRTNLFTNAKIIYTTGYVLVHSADSLLNIARSTLQYESIFSLNLAAEYILEVPQYLQALMNLLPYTQYLFGNESEVLAFAKAQNWKITSIKQISQRISNLPKAFQGDRFVIVTQGVKDTIVCRGLDVFEFPVNAIDIEKIVDTNGAGDSFTGGFLSKLIENGSLEECVQLGHQAASYIIQKTGTDFD